MSSLAINEITTYRWSLLEDVTGYCEAGIEAIGIWRPKLVEFGEERGIELIRDSGLTVSSLSWAGGFTGSNGHSYAEALDDAREAIRMAGEMNAESVVIVSGARSGHTLNHARRLLVEGLRELTDLAAEHDLMLAIQPMHSLFSDEWTFVTSIDETLNILSQCDRRYVGMLFDVYHLWQEPRLIERIPEIVPFVTSVQLNDWREPPQPLGSPRSENDRCLLGEGIIPLSEITRAFVEANYHGYFEIEIWSDEVWNADYDQLLHLCRRGFDAFCRH